MGLQPSTSILKGVKMASRRVAATSVNWAEFAKKVPASQKASFQALKQKVDTFQRAVTSLPDKAPAIDFNSYKSKIAVAGMVDDFQKKYEALDIPYPKDNLTATIDQQAVQKKQEYQKFVAASQEKIAAINTEKGKWENMIPIEDMTREEFLVLVQRKTPHIYEVPDVENPRFWPHNVDYDEWLAEARKIQAANPH